MCGGDAEALDVSTRMPLDASTGTGLLFSWVESGTEGAMSGPGVVLLRIIIELLAVSALLSGDALDVAPPPPMAPDDCVFLSATASLCDGRIIIRSNDAYYAYKEKVMMKVPTTFGGVRKGKRPLS